MQKRREFKSAGEPRYCQACGARRDADDRFCRKCGAALAGSGKPNGKMKGLTGLRAFGLGVIALAAAFAFLYYGVRSDPPPPAQTIPISAVGGQPIEQAAPGSLSGRAAADQLFNEAMTAYETGDAATAQRIIPMALSAYQGLATIDLDNRYHMALLSLAAARPRDALAQADTMLAEVPGHLLALSASASAHEALGDLETAAEFWQRFLDAYTPENAASRSEYMDHARALPARRDYAEQFLRQRE